MSTRFDNRNVNTFKRDIKFGTQLESYFFDEWTKRCDINIKSWSHNGCDNTGEFIDKGNTSGADYRVNNKPLELKWVPTAGKFTLKKNDLKAYIREGADILFIYNTGSANLRKPSDYNLDMHIQRIKKAEPDIRWGIMSSDKVKKLYNDAQEEGWFKPIPYMGNKTGVILLSKDYNNYFAEKQWTTK